MKNICGIVAEYNPFHAGHAYHIRRSRELLGAEAAVVCVMSGNFVQRGEPAVFEKHARAEAAVRCGADLVLELPLPWALSSAEGFAQGAVSILSATGLVTHLSFGSERGGLDELRAAAELLRSPALDGLLRDGLSEGLSYAAARQRAAETLAGAPLPALREPNAILGVEYLKALALTGSGMVPLTVQRLGAGHDAGAETDALPCSASQLRARLRHGELPPGALPPEAAAVFDRERGQGRGPVYPEHLAQAVLSRLRTLGPEDFAGLPGAEEGLECRLCRSAAEEPGLEEILDRAATRRYARSRLRRMLWAAALGLRKGDAAAPVPYLRVLAATAEGRRLLAQMRGSAALPVLTRPGAVRELDAAAQKVFCLEAAATDLYVLGYADAASRRGGSEWRQHPVML